MGQSAPPEVLQKLTYLAIRHPKVKRIDTVRAYTFGVLYFVEVGHLSISTSLVFQFHMNRKDICSRLKSHIFSQTNKILPFRVWQKLVYHLKQVDIELPEDLPLKEAHMIGEALQVKLEKLPEVERAFVHLDFECEHKPEHSVVLKLPSSQPWLTVISIVKYLFLL